MEKEPGEPSADETSPGNLPETVDQTAPETEEAAAEFVESAEMTAIRARIEKGEELTVELYTAYQIAGENVVKSLPDNERNLANLYMQLDCAKLLAKGGHKSEALEAVNDLANGLPVTDFYILFKMRAADTAEIMHMELTSTSGKISIENFEGEIGEGTEVPVTIDGYDLELVVLEVDDLHNVTLGLFIPNHRYARKTLTISREGNIFSKEKDNYEYVLPNFDKTDNEPVFQSSDQEIAQQMVEALRHVGK